MSVFLNNNLNATLPVLAYPFKGENLIGYLLRLDNLNGLLPGTIIKYALRRKKPVRIKDLGDILKIEKEIDTCVLSDLLSMSEDLIRNLMISQIFKRLYRYSSWRISISHPLDLIRVCPLCIEEWKLPNMFLLYDLWSCPVHNVHLVNRCSCGRKIDLSISNKPLICSRKECGKSYNSMIELMNDEGKFFLYKTLEEIFSNDIPLVRSNEKVIKGLKERVNFLTQIKNEAIKCIRKSIISNGNEIELQYDFGKFNTRSLLHLEFLVSIMEEYRLSPYQFYSFKIPRYVEIKSYIKEVKVIKMTYIYGTDVMSDAQLHLQENHIGVLAQLDEELDLSSKFERKSIHGKVNIECDYYMVALRFIISQSRYRCDKYYISELEIEDIKYNNDLFFTIELVK